MKITDIRVDGFGVWNTLSVEQLAPDVTVFYGRNEAGKTTLMQYLRAVLYGFSAERRHLYLPPVFGGEAGGLLRVFNHSGEFTVERRADDDDHASPGHVVVLAASGSRQGQHLLNVLLSGIDETIFNNVFAIGIRELQELATLNDTQAAEQLYSLASGVDRVSLVEVMRDLHEQRDGLWEPHNKHSSLLELLAKRDKLQGEIDELERQSRRWADLAQLQRSLVGEVAELEQRIETAEFEGRTVEIAIQVRDKWRTRADLVRQLKTLGPVEPLPEDCLPRLDALNQSIAQQREQLGPWKQRRTQVRRQLAAQPINRALWDNASRIEALVEQGPWIATLDHELGELKRQIEADEVELLRCDEELAGQGGVELASGVVVNDRTFQALQTPAIAVREAQRKRSLAHTHHKKNRTAANSTADEFAAELTKRRVENFDEAIERAGLLVKQLRRRVQCDERIEQLWRQSEELEHDNHKLLDDQFRRVRLLVGIGVMFVVGFTLILTGLFGWNVIPEMTMEMCWATTFIGLVTLGLSAAWKSVAERTSHDELEACTQQREALEREIEQSLDTREQLDRELPPGAGTFANRLAAAERDLKELEAMAPLHQDRQENDRLIKQSRRTASSADEEFRETLSRWRRALRTAGLPETLTPKHVRQLATHHARKSKVQSRLVELRQRLQKIEADRRTLVQRLHALNQDIGVTVVSPDPQVQLSQLATALAGQKGMVTQRREWQREEKEARRQLSVGMLALRKLLRQRESLFAEVRVADEAELRARAELLVKVHDLTVRRNALAEQIQAIIGGHCQEADIEQELQSHAKAELELRWNAIIQRLQDSQVRLGQLHTRQGEVGQEMRQLGENRRLAAARFERASLEQQIHQSLREWHAAGVTLQLLEQIREKYEAERQPETLGEASLYLEKLTNGKYTRIWTPLGKHELRVNDRHGQELSLDVLSRGTREAIFLSLRLALVSAYHRRGINLPMVLDDVLVNLDIDRARAAVRVLCEFAREGRQMLFFTCHDHVREMFWDAAVDVRVLPAHGTPGIQVRRQDRPTPLPAPEKPPEPAAKVEWILEENPAPVVVAAVEPPAGELPAELAAVAPPLEPPDECHEDYRLQEDEFVPPPEIDRSLYDWESEWGAEPIEEFNEVFAEVEEPEEAGSFWWEPRSRSTRPLEHEYIA